MLMSNSNGSNRPLILVSNDDGIDAPGIRALTNALMPVGGLFCSSAE